MIEYTNLHTHSEHSLLDGAAKIVSLAESAAKMGQKYLALTDHGSLCGAVAHKKACEKNGVKPLFGCELFMIETFDADLSKTKEQNLHLTVLAKDQKGFELLLKSQGFANQYGVGKSWKFKRAFLPIRYPLENGWKDHVVILSGCASSPFYNLKNSDGIELFREYAAYFGKDFYGEIMPLHDWDYQQEQNALVHEVSNRLGVKLVTTNDIHYCGAEDHNLHELIIAMSDRGMTWNNPRRWKFSTHQNYFRTAEDMLQSLCKMGLGEDVSRGSIINTMEVAEKTSFKLEKYGLDLPNPLPQGIDESEYFYQLCHKGMKDRLLEHQDIYWQRLEKEIEVLESKGFVRYMLIVADLINWSKSNGIFIGPARGSSAGSLVAYVLKITEVDPIQHGLMFERFVAPDRNDLPDIDIDVEDRRRGSVENYLREKYGDDNVGHLSTFQELLGRSALRDVARIFEVPPDETDKAAKTIIKRLDSDARAYDTIEDTINESQEFREYNDKYPQIVDFASKLEGQIRGVGVHAAGYVLSNNKLNDSSRCYLVEGNSGIKAVNWDKDDLEFFGLVKIDLLGLAMHSVISGCLELIERRLGKKVLMNELPLDDSKVIESIGKGETAAVFQLSTPGLTRFCKDLIPENFQDIAATTALWRPGPIQAGMATAYAEVRHGRLKPEYLCKEHEAIASPTRGQLIYQEQITELLIQLSGMTYSRADSVRKVMGKRLGAGEWQKYEEEFVQGCKSKGTINEVQAVALWERLKGFAIYCFNKSHAVAYGLISYWTAYLKLYYPAEYLCAYLNFGSTDKENSEGETNLDIALGEAQRLGIKILPPSVRNSLEDWSVASPKSLRAGLKEIRNIGPAAKEELTRLRAHFASGFGSIEQFVSIAEKRKLNVRGVKSLVASGAFDDMPDAKDYRTKLELTGEKSERAEYLNYDESKLFSRDQILKDMAAALRGEVVNDLIVVGESKLSFEDAFNGRFPSTKVGLINEDPIKGINQVRKDTTECKACELRDGCNKPVPLEKGKYNLMIVGESPGYNEDKRSRPLIGKSGQALFEALEEFGLTRDMFYVDQVLHCKPPQGSKPSLEILSGCRHLGAAIETIKPKAVLALGNSALYKFLGKEKGILSFAGTTQWSPKYKTWVTYCVNPGYAARDDGDSEGRMKVFRRGLEEFKRVVYNLFGK